jgi:hypothetical protein
MLKLNRFLFILLGLAGCGLMANAIGQVYPYAPQIGPAAFVFGGSTGTFVVNGLNGQNFCSVTVTSGSTMGSGTITAKVSNDNGTTYYAVSGVADLGNPASPAATQTITSAGVREAFPVSGSTQFELVLSGATSAAINGTVTCSSANGVVINSSSGGAQPSFSASPPVVVATPAGQVNISCPTCSTGGGAGAFPIALRQSAVYGGSAAAVSTIAPTYPTTPTTGDLLMFIVSVSNFNSNVVSTPSGWTATGATCTNAGSGNPQINTYTKTSAGNETGFSTTQSASGKWSGVLLDFAGSHALDKVGTTNASPIPSPLTYSAPTPSAAPTTGAGIITAGVSGTEYPSTYTVLPGNSNDNWTGGMAGLVQYQSMVVGFWQGTVGTQTLVYPSFMFGNEITGGGPQGSACAVTFSII